MSVNKVILLGNVGADPTVRFVDKTPVAEFSLATTERAFRNSAGVEIPERTEWHRITMWGGSAEIAEKYIKKGTKLYLEGRLRTNTWTDRNNISHKTTEIMVENFEILSRPQTASSSNS